MSSTYSRREILSVCTGSICIGFAGCQEDASRGPGTTSTAVTFVSDAEAKQRALEAEKWHIFDRLQNAPCVTSGAASGTTVESSATVSKRTADGVEVGVTHGYHFSTTDGLEADDASNARYLVTSNRTQRIEGDTIDPC